MRLPEQTLPDKRYYAAFALLMALVLLWGIGHRFYETVMPQFAAVFDLRGTSLALTQSAYQIVYVIGAIPAALIARCFGYKTAILMGLGCVSVGALTFYPATVTQGYSYFLFAVLLLAFGWILLEVAGNSLVMVMGTPSTAARRLNLVQSIYPIGSLIGIYSARWILHANLALPQHAFAYSIAHPYILLGCSVLLFAYLIEETRFPPAAQERVSHLDGVMADARALLSAPLFVFALIAQFANILALGTIWFLADSFFRVSFPELSSHEFAAVFVWCLILFALGRFLATALMGLASPARVLTGFTMIGIVVALLAAASGGAIAAIGSVLLCFFVAPAWPTIFALAVGERAARLKLAAGAVCMAGALGAVAYHFLTSIPPQAALLIPAACCAVMAAYGYAVARADQRAEEAA